MKYVDVIRAVEFQKSGSAPTLATLRAERNRAEELVSARERLAIAQADIRERLADARSCHSRADLGYLPGMVRELKKRIVELEE